MHTVLLIMSILFSLNLASALFHLIPGAFRLDEIIPEKYLNIALAVFGGVYLFFIIERLLRFAMVIRFVFIESAIVPTKETRMCGECSAEIGSWFCTVWGVRL